MYKELPKICLLKLAVDKNSDTVPGSTVKCRGLPPQHHERFLSVTSLYPCNGAGLYHTRNSHGLTFFRPSGFSFSEPEISYSHKCASKNLPFVLSPHSDRSFVLSQALLILSASSDLAGESPYILESISNIKGFCQTGILSFYIG